MSRSRSRGFVAFSISVSLGLSAFGLATVSASARPVATSGAARASGSDVDTGSVIETVTHHVDAVAPGRSQAVDDRYRATFTTNGFSLALRQRISERRAAALAGPMPTDVDVPGKPDDGASHAGGNVMPSAIPFQRAAAFAVSTTLASTGGEAVSPTAPWSSELNTASRSVGPGITERVTALEGSLEWDFLLGAAPSGDVVVEARVSAPGALRLAEDGAAWVWGAGDGRSVRVGRIVVRDAAGRELHRALPDATQTSISFTVPRSAIDDARYPITIDPTITPAYPATDPVYASNGSDQFTPAVASDGTDFLVVWIDCREYHRNLCDLYGTRITQEGAVLDPSGIPLSTTADYEYTPEIAWNGSHYLLAWEHYPAAGCCTNSDVYAQRFTAAGIPAGAQTVVAAGGLLQASPAVSAYGTSWLVAWADQQGDSTYDIEAQRVSSAGALTGSEIVVSNDPSHQLTPSIAAVGNDLLVVWADYRNLGTTSIDVFGQLVDGTTGGLTGTNFPISTATGNQSAPSVATNGTDFLVAYQDGRTPVNGDDIAAQRVTGAGALDGPEIPVAVSSQLQQAPTVAWNGVRWIVFWQDNVFGSFDVRAQRILTTGAFFGSKINVVTSQGSQSAPAVAFNETRFLLAYNDDRNGDLDAFASLLTSEGVFSLGNFTVSRSASGQIQADVAWDGTNYLVVWYDDRAQSLDIYGARVAPDGSILDGSGIPIAVSAYAEGTPRVVWGGGRYLVVWDVIGETFQWDVHGARMTADGAVLDRTPIVISAAARRQGVPEAAWNGQTFLVVWEDFRDATGIADIWGSRVTLAGQVLDPAGIQITAEATTQSTPTVASNGTDFLVAWTDGRDATFWATWGRSVAADGSLGPEADMAPAQATDGNQFVPDVASDGEAYLVAWEDYRPVGGIDPEQHIVGQLVDTAGTRVGDNFEIAHSSVDPDDDEGVPAIAFDGTNFVVVWHDTRDRPTNDWDLYAGRVAPDGTLIDGLAGFAVAASSGRDGWPNAVAGPPGTVAFSYERFSGEPLYGSVTRAFFGIISVELPTAPTLTKPSVPFQKAKNVALAWTPGAAGENALDGYVVRTRRAPFNGPFGAPTESTYGPGTTTATIVGTTGSTHCFAAAAVDDLGYRSAWSAERCTAVPLNNTELVHVGSWAKKTGSGYYLNTYSRTTQKGATLTKNGVRAKRLAVVVTKCSGCGTFQVLMGGTSVAKVNTNASQTKKKQLVILPAFASLRTGTLKIKVLTAGKPVIVEGVGVSAV